jgi:hypothetical protein
MAVRIDEGAGTSGGRTGGKAWLRESDGRNGVCSGPSKNQIRRFCQRTAYQPQGPYRSVAGGYECPVFRKRTREEMAEHKERRAHRRGTRVAKAS